MATLQVESGRLRHRYWVDMMGHVALSSPPKGCALDRPWKITAKGTDRLCDLGTREKIAVGPRGFNDVVRRESSASVADECSYFANCKIAGPNTVTFELKGLVMRCIKRSFTAIAALTVFLSWSGGSGGLDAGDVNLGSFTLAAAQTAKRQCINTCRARYRDCLSLKQIPSFECRGVYRDCVRYTCSAVQG
jgi:hypothetical protein